MTDKLCARFKKSAHKKFPGFELWKQCLARNKEAFKEMEQYNKMDVLSLEELYTKISPWDKGFPSVCTPKRPAVTAGATTSRNGATAAP